jgi:hypothetical protein
MGGHGCGHGSGTDAEPSLEELRRRRAELDHAIARCEDPEAKRSRQAHTSRAGGEGMYGWDHMSGWGWLVGSLTMVVWLALLGLIVFVAVRLAQDRLT